MKAVMGMELVAAGMKNPITVEPTSNFETSEKYFERISTCPFVNFIANTIL